MLGPRISALLLSVALLGGCGKESSPAGEGVGPVAWPVSLAPAEAEAPRFERVVLVTIDTLRADHVSSYGYPRKTTPFLDSMAERGVRFARATAAVSHTAPSHATMLTGVVPSVHGVLQNGGQLPPGALDLAALFRSKGFDTAAFLNVKFLKGIASSFEHVEVRTVGRDGGLLDGSDVVGGAMAWIDRAPTRERFFLWVHLYDPHKWKDLALQYDTGAIWSGETPPDFLARIAELHGLPAPKEGEPYSVDWRVEVVKKKQGERVDFSTGEAFLRCIDAYDELVRLDDGQIERLYRHIEGKGFPGRTLWIVTSDHGEGLASHQVAGHGGRIYQEQLGVPLFLFTDDGSLAPRVVDELVGHVDLFPTLAATLGRRAQGPAPLYEGRSLWPLVVGEEGAGGARALFAQRREGGDEEEIDGGSMFALQTARSKYILHEPGADEFFDLAADPAELRNLGEEAPGAAALREALGERLRILRGAASGRPVEEVPEEWAQELRDLGYAR